MTLVLARADWEMMAAHVERCRPHEACGLLAGTGGRVRRVYLVDNVAHSPVEYRMAAGAQVRAMLEMEAAGWDLAAIFHSHPNGPAEPSATDVAQAYYPEAAYLILSPAAAGWQGRAFTIADGRVTEMPVRVE